MGATFPDSGGARTGKFAQMAQIARAQAPPVRRRHPAQSLLSFLRSTPSSAHFMPHFKQLSVLRDARAVTASHHKGLLRQAIEIVRMKKRNPGLGASDYFAFRLYDEDYLGTSRPEDFVGWREEGDVALILNARSGVAPAWDKLIFAIFARAYGLPVPRLKALYRPGVAPSTAIAEISFDTREKLAAWLREQAEWPLFAKPAFSEQGYGCFCFTGYDRRADALTTKRGESIPVEVFTGEILGTLRHELRSYKRELGYLFQEVLRPHERIGELLGTDTISGVRVILAQDETGLEFVSAEWKMAIGDSDTDNIRDYSRGNISGEVDLATGRVKRVVGGQWPHASLVTRISTTKRTVSDFVLPDWAEALALCRRAAAMVPLMRMQHWDIALTNRGPCLLEVNDMGSLAGQVYGRGVLTPFVRTLLQRHGNPARYALAKRLAARRPL